LSDERDSAALYETLADAEHDVERKQVYTELAASERDHAQVWSERLRKMG
jgi:rubrerythrin